MKTQEFPVTDIKVLVGLGIVATALLVILPVIALGYFFMEAGRHERCIGHTAEERPDCKPSFIWKLYEAEQPENTPNMPVGTVIPEGSGLGGEGSVCGGPERFPCMPGFACENGSETELGVCMKAAVETTITTRNLGDACGDAIGPCTVGAVCKLSPGGSSGVCIKADDKAPQVLSLKLDGMAFDQGWYTAEPDTRVEVTVHTLNAVSVSTKFDAPGKSYDGISVDLKREEGGRFTGAFTVIEGLKAGFVVTVTDKDGQQASMSVNVATR